MKDFTIVYIFPSTDKFVSGLSAVISADWEGQVKVPQCSKSLYIPAYIHKACLNCFSECSQLQSAPTDCRNQRAVATIFTLGCLFMFVCLCILHQSCLTITAGTTNCPILGGIGFQSTPPLEGAGVFNVPEGDSSQNTEPPFIAWFELLVSQTRSLASIMLDFSCGAPQRWL